VGGLDNLKDQVEQVAAEPLDPVKETSDAEETSDQVSRPGGDGGHRATGDVYTEILLKGR
jgi:hypothetical protein